MAVYVRAFGLAALAALLQWGIQPLAGARTPFLFFIPVLLWVAWSGGRGPALLVVLLGAVNGTLLIQQTHAAIRIDEGDLYVLLAYVALGIALTFFCVRMQSIPVRAIDTEQRLSLVQRDAGIGLFELDYLAGTALVSPSLCRLLEQDVVTGPISLERWLAMLPQDHVEDSKRSLEQRLRAGDLNYEREQEFNLPDGKKRWLLSRIRLEVAPDGKLASAYGATMDITQRKELDLALRESQAQLKRRVEELDCLHQSSMRLLHINELPDQLALILQTVIDFQGATKGLVALRDPADDARYRIVAQRGFSPATLEAIPRLVANNATVQDALANGNPVVLEDVESDPRFAGHLELMRQEGIRAAHGTPLIGSTGEVLGLLNVHFAEPRAATERETRLAEILARKAAVFVERANARASAKRIDQRFRVALESSAVPFDILSPVRDDTGFIVDFRFEYLNPEGAKFLRRPAEQLLGQLLSEVFPGVWHLPGLLDHHRAVLESGEAREFELQSSRDGRNLWLHVVASPLADAIAIWFSDITERKQHAQMLEEADRRKDEFLATLAHELRNPLAPIRYAIQILRAGSASPEQRSVSYEVIDRQVGHMALMLDDLLDVSRITRGAFQLRKAPTELAQVVSAGIEIARPLIESKGHELRVDLGPESILIDVDPLRLAQVMGNLLTNAAKYTDSGGRIQIASGCENDIAWIAVSDTGVGISSDSLQDVFAMFTQVKTTDDRSRGGLGIGLALARGLVNLHDGSLEVQSEGLGKGSCFTVRLPACQAVQLGTNAEDVPTLSGGRFLQILVADDNKDAAETLAMLLRLEGHDVALAFDGEAAWSEFQRIMPDIALLDMGMPKLSGEEVARKIRTLTKRPSKLIAISGWGQADDKRRAYEAGFDHHVTKPIDMPTLRQLLDEN